jgi:hypothetical protein
MEKGEENRNVNDLSLTETTIAMNVPKGKRIVVFLITPT